MDTLMFLVLPVLAALLLIWLALRLLGSKEWISGWVRGTAGLLLLALSVVAVLGVWDMTGFRSARDQSPLAIISFSKNDIGPWEAEIAGMGAGFLSIAIDGELWTLEAEHFSWNLWGQQGQMVRPARLKGRYLALEQERSRPPAGEMALYSTHYGINSWLAMAVIDPLKAVSARTLSAPYSPMKHGAIYEVLLEGSRLVVQPVNEAAHSAVSLSGREQALTP